jgi:two-component system nitrogen regulation response regulator GlnG
VLAPGREVRVEDLPPEARGGRAGDGAESSWTQALTAWGTAEAARGGPPLLDTALPEFERILIRVALQRTQGHRQDAARLLGWGRNTLTRKLKELGMSDIDETV